MSLTVAIAGRPNVGKSTLFNRLVGRRAALVDATPGLTRDWREGEAALGDLRFRVIDTAGLEDAPRESIAHRMREQTERVIDRADLVLFVVDAQTGITPQDEDFARWLRRQNRPVLLVANKAEGRGAQGNVGEAFALGLGEPVAVSALHGEGFSALAEALAPFARQDDAAAAAPPAGAIQLAIIGRPNAGKSTLFNALLGDERALTGPEPGLTRDAVVIDWSYRGESIRLIDTAGLRKRAKVSERAERLAVSSTLEAIRFAHVVVLVLDAERGLEKQDLTLAALVAEEGRAPVFAVNKWDGVANPRATLKALRHALDEGFGQGRGCALVPLSALTGAGVAKLMPAVLRTYALWNRRIGTARLNRWLNAIIAHHPPPSAPASRIRLRYLTQVNTRPPTFALFLNRPEKFPESYRRYLVNALRTDFRLDGVPIRLMLRKGENPYEEVRGKRRG